MGERGSNHNNTQDLVFALWEEARLERKGRFATDFLTLPCSAVSPELLLFLFSVPLSWVNLVPSPDSLHDIASLMLPRLKCQAHTGRWR